MDKNRNCKKYDQKGKQRGYVKSYADRDADASRCPESRRRRKSRDLRAIADYDRADSEKADSRDYLCGYSHRVCGKAENSNLVNTRHCGKRCSKADKNVRAQSRRSAVIPALKSYATAQDQRKQNTEANAPNI